MSTAITASAAIEASEPSAEKKGPMLYMIR